MIEEIHIGFPVELVEVILDSRVFSSCKEPVLILVRMADGIVIASSYRGDTRPDINLRREPDCGKILPFVLNMLENDRPFSTQIGENFSLIWNMERD